jgi:hypothetical protein
MLTDREKFIAHYVSVSIIGALGKEPEDASRKVIDALHNARTKNLSWDERDKIQNELTQEFLMSQIFLDDRRKTKEDTTRYGWGDMV